MSDSPEMKIIDALSDGYAHGSSNSTVHGDDADEQQGAMAGPHPVVTDEPHPVVTAKPQHTGGGDDGASATSSKGSSRSYPGSYKDKEEWKEFRLFRQMRRLQKNDTRSSPSSDSSVSSLSTSVSHRRKAERVMRRLYKYEAGSESATTPTKQKPAAAEESPTGAADNAIKEDAGEKGAAAENESIFEQRRKEMAITTNLKNARRVPLTVKSSSA